MNGLIVLAAALALLYGTSVLANIVNDDPHHTVTMALVVLLLAVFALGLGGYAVMVALHNGWT